MGILISEVPVNKRIEILGRMFNGLREIRNAVEVRARVENSIFGGRSIWRTGPRKEIPGIHVLELYEPYPCFDSEDYASENRQYSNFFFSEKPFTDADINRLAKLDHRCNYRIVKAGIQESALPAVYYVGEGNMMTVAYPEP